jgi:hypothetical protein
MGPHIIIGLIKALKMIFKLCLYVLLDTETSHHNSLTSIEIYLSWGTPENVVGLFNTDSARQLMSRQDHILRLGCFFMNGAFGGRP